MHCTQCGTAANPGDKFCAQCGSALHKPNPRPSQHRRQIAQTFQSPIQRTLFSDPERLGTMATQWLREQKPHYVRLNLNISNSQVLSLTLTCEVGDSPPPFMFGLDGISMVRKSLGSVIRSMRSRPQSEDYIHAWTASHPAARIVTQRVVSGGNIPVELWILYKELRSS